MKVGVWYHPDFAEKGYPSLRHRVKPAFDALGDMIDRGEIQVFSPEVNRETEELLAIYHSPRHIEKVKAQGYHEVALLSAAGVIEAGGKLAQGELDFAFCFVGTAGHHAGYEDFWGFCYYNDVAMAVGKLRRLGLKKIMIIDVDPHFGDGTRHLLGGDPDIIHVNFHDDDGLKLSNQEFQNYDIGLYNANDTNFLKAVDEILEEPWEYEILIVIFGHDSHSQDYGGFYLTEAGFLQFARNIRAFGEGKPILFVLSGGSNPQVAREVIPMVIDVFVE